MWSTITNILHEVLLRLVTLAFGEIGLDSHLIINTLSIVGVPTATAVVAKSLIVVTDSFKVERAHALKYRVDLKF